MTSAGRDGDGGDGMGEKHVGAHIVSSVCVFVCVCKQPYSIFKWTDGDDNEGDADADAGGDGCDGASQSITLAHRTGEVHYMCGSNMSCSTYFAEISTSESLAILGAVLIVNCFA